jgi:hypothetical protein
MALYQVLPYPVVQWEAMTSFRGSETSGSDTCWCVVTVEIPVGANLGCGILGS